MGISKKKSNMVKYFTKCANTHFFLEFVHDMLGWFY